ncbi:RAD52 motif-containing protein 1 [Camelus dromedarius]|uniref:RAD52 motif-containing protein 1 n=1 Tax=Camelus dromedarius TaxID=9838 RepID=A0A5N4D121_CAMDR|nr:RAD52 motif-containing protein 1 [Camelus dromedarius]
MSTFSFVSTSQCQVLRPVPHTGAALGQSSEGMGGGGVRLGTRHKMFQPNALALSSSRCQELANYYFGFNGWSKRIIKKQSLKFCALEVMLTSYEARSPGAGITEEPLDKLEEENSKMAVVYRPCEEVTGARTEEEVRDLIQVCGDKNSRGTQPMSP